MDQRIRGQALEPQSVVASTVLAEGSITAPLLQTLLVLTTAIVAGDPDGAHARLNQNGLRIFRVNPDDPMLPPEEVIRLGTETNDYFGVVDSDSQLVASIDDTGSFMGRKGVFDEVWVGGRNLVSLLSEYPQGEVGRFAQKPNMNIGPLWDRFGIATVGAPMIKGRAYRVDWRMTFRTETAGDEVLFKLVWAAGAANDLNTPAPTPSINSFVHQTWQATGERANYWYTVSGSTQFYPPETTRYNLGMMVQRGVGGSAFGMFHVPDDIVELMITDLGPAGPVTGGFNAMGGSFGIPSGPGTGTAPPVTNKQQYFVDLAPAGFVSYRGDGSTRPLGDGVVQGWDPSGYNGDGGGFWWFNLPSITGVVDAVDWYCYSYHWNLNSGGIAIFNMIPGGAQNNFMALKLRGDWHVGGYPKPGGREVRLPSDWWNQFHNTPAAGPRAAGISVGRSGGTNPLYYGKFDGPSARLRIWYTQ